MMARGTVVFYEDAHGRSDVLEFLDGLNPKARAKCVSYMRLLEDPGPPLPRQYAAHVRGRIWELRPEYSGTEHRFLYAALPGNRQIILSGFTKKRRALREEDIVRAEQRLAEFERRSGP